MLESTRQEKLRFAFMPQADYGKAVAAALEATERLASMHGAPRVAYRNPDPVRLGAVFVKCGAAHYDLIDPATGLLGAIEYVGNQRDLVPVRTGEDAAQASKRAALARAHYAQSRREAKQQDILRKLETLGLRSASENIR